MAIIDNFESGGIVAYSGATAAFSAQTTGLLAPGTGQTEKGVFHHRCRVTDAAGNRSTIFHGSFTIYV